MKFASQVIVDCYDSLSVVERHELLRMLLRREFGHDKIEMPANDDAQQTEVEETSIPMARRPVLAYRIANRSKSILDLLETRPGLHVDEIAKVVYGELTKETKAKANSLLGSLKRQGKVRNCGRGEFERVPMNGHVEERHPDHEAVLDT